jgi:hypothetical protein
MIDLMPRSECMALLRACRLTLEIHVAVAAPSGVSFCHVESTRVLSALLPITFLPDVSGGGVQKERRTSVSTIHSPSDIPE